MSPRGTVSVGAVLLLIAWVVGVQISAGAYRADFSADNDEAAHAVSSLLIRDYAVHGFPANPLRYAEAYYAHYPKVAIGHWPPLFYAGEAAWMLVFGRTRAAMVAFLAALAIALLTSVFLWVRRDYGTGAGLISALALAAPQFMQSSITTVAPNIALALIAFWAAVLLGDYLDRGQRRDAVLFAILALDAIAVHWRGVAVAFLPAALLLTGRFAWTRLRAAILAATIAVVLIVPWLLAQANRPRILDILRDAVVYLYGCGAAMSWPVFLLACAGAFVVIRHTATPRRWLAMPALVLSGWIFHSLVNAGWADRYLATAAPGVAALAGAGYRYCANSRMARAACLVIVGAGLTWIALPPARKPDLGYHRMIAVPGKIDLIAGSPLHEGAFVSEMALRDRGLDRIVLRGSKVLAVSTWMGNRYELLFTTPAEVLAYLDRARVETVLFEQASRQPHVALLSAALASDAARWRPVHFEGQPAGVTAFERAAPLPPGHPEIRLDLRYTLRKTIELQP